MRNLLKVLLTLGLLTVGALSASAEALSVVVIPTQLPDSEAEAIARATPLLAARLTSTGRFVMLADSDALARLDRAREDALVSPTELREAQLREARRSFAALAVELNLSAVGRGRWLASIAVFDTSTSEGIHTDTELLEGHEDAIGAAQVGVDALARRMVNAPAITSRERGQQARGGSLEIVDVTPTPLTVRVNGRDAGFAPGLLVDLPIGPVRIELGAPGYQTLEQEMTLSAGSVTRLAGANLEPAVASWSITADRAGASIAIDGVEVSRTQEGSPVAIEVPLNASLITVSLTGYVPFTQRIGWQSQQSQELQISLRPIDGPDGISNETADCSRTGAVDRLRTCRVSAGEAWMGDDEGRSESRPQRQVMLTRPFRMHRDEIRVEAWRVCVDAGACAEPGDVAESSTPALSNAANALCNWGAPGRSEHPMNCVSWEAAQQYCQWAGGELPSESEWERAARGMDGRLLPWDLLESQLDDDDCERAFFGRCQAAAGTRPAGERPQGASPWGINDLIGNVAEWTLDRWDASAYRSLASTDPMNDEAGRRRVVRGGSWRTLMGVNVASRARLDEDVRSDHVGFRCVFYED